MCNRNEFLTTAITRGDLKNKILVQDQGGRTFQSAGILLYFEELKREPNPATGGNIGLKDIFEMASNHRTVPTIVTSMDLLLARLSWFITTTCCQVPKRRRLFRMATLIDGPIRAAWTWL